MLFKSLARATADASVFLGLRDRSGALGTTLEGLLKEPVSWFEEHALWPSDLTAEGIPVELAVGIGKDGAPSIACVVDINDYHLSISENWQQSLTFIRDVVGLEADSVPELAHLFSLRFDGIPASQALRMAYGVGLTAGAGPLKRTLYFQTRWLRPDAVEALFPEYAQVIHRTLDRYGGLHPAYIFGLGYDLSGSGHVAKVKMYGKYDGYGEALAAADVVGGRPDVTGARKVLKRYAATSLGGLHNGVRTQLRFRPGAEYFDLKVEYLCEAMGWRDFQKLLGLLSFLSDTFDLNVRQPWAFSSVFSKHGIGLIPSFVTVGADGPHHPPIGFYFVPAIGGVSQNIFVRQTLDAAPAGPPDESGTVAVKEDGPYRSRLDTVEAMIAAATEYVLGSQDADGCWIDFQSAPEWSDEWVTAYIVAVLAAHGNTHRQLAPAIDWLRSRYRPGEGWGFSQSMPADADATALAVLALYRMGAPLPEDCKTLFQRYCLPSNEYRMYAGGDGDGLTQEAANEITATVLWVMLETDLGTARTLRDGLSALMAQQRPDGSWPATWWRDDFFAVDRGVRVLRAALEIGVHHLPDEMIRKAGLAITDAGSYVISKPGATEPWALGLRLSSTFTADRTRYDRDVDRILQHLRRVQGDDGQWPAVPMRRTLCPTRQSVDMDQYYADSWGLITTATVIDGLHTLREAMEELQYVQSIAAR